VAERRLPEIDALMERAARVRTWLQAATECACQGIDECALFDDAALPPAPHRAPFAVAHTGSPRA
jgi:hypothetical protein